jgi:hypothetical protein
MRFGNETALAVLSDSIDVVAFPAFGERADLWSRC